MRLCGGTLAGKRVLDLGCNAGYWALQAIDAGCDFVLGIDGRQMHIDQAELVFAVKGVDPNRYRFIQANVFEYELSQEQPFDIVLCLGLMYHVAKPVSLVELISAANLDLLVIDTSLAPVAGSFLELRREPLDEPTHAVDHELVSYPTRQAVVDMTCQFGYLARVLEPRFSSWVGAGDFETGHRRAFLCAKHTSLDRAELDFEQGDPRLSRRIAAESNAHQASVARLRAGLARRDAKLDKRESKLRSALAERDALRRDKAEASARALRAERAWRASSRVVYGWPRSRGEHSGAGCSRPAAPAPMHRSDA